MEGDVGSFMHAFDAAFMICTDLCELLGMNIPVVTVMEPK